MFKHPISSWRDHSKSFMRSLPLHQVKKIRELDSDQLKEISELGLDKIREVKELYSDQYLKSREELDFFKFTQHISQNSDQYLIINKLSHDQIRALIMLTIEQLEAIHELIKD